MPNPNLVTAGVAAAGIGGYGAASRYAPGTTSFATTAGGAYLGARYGGSALRSISRAGGFGAGAARGARTGLAAARRATPLRAGGIALPRGRMGGGIAGAAAGYAMSRVTRALFGKSNNRSTSMRSNYGYR